MINGAARLFVWMKNSFGKGPQVPSFVNDHHLARKEGKKKLNLATLSILPEDTDFGLQFTIGRIRMLGIGLELACNWGHCKWHCKATENSNMVSSSLGREDVWTRKNSKFMTSLFLDLSSLRSYTVFSISVFGRFSVGDAFSYNQRLLRAISW